MRPELCDGTGQITAARADRPKAVGGLGHELDPVDRSQIPTRPTGRVGLVDLPM